MDSLTHYLQSQGIEVIPAYFGKSRLEIGKRWETRNWEMVYRLEKGELIICHFASKKNATGLSSAVKQFIEQLQIIRRNVAGVRRIRGLIIDCCGTLEQQQAARELKTLMLQKGAREELIDGDLWLVG